MNVMIIVILLSACLNFLQFNSIDNNAITRYKAIHSYHISDIREIGLESSSAFRRHFGIAAVLGLKYPGSIIIAPKKDLNTHFFHPGLLAFGRAAIVKKVNYDANTLVPDLNYKPYVVASGHYKPKGKYLAGSFEVVAKTNEPTTFILIRRGSTKVLLEASLLPPKVRCDIYSRLLQ